MTSQMRTISLTEDELAEIRSTLNVIPRTYGGNRAKIILESILKKAKEPPIDLWREDAPASEVPGDPVQSEKQEQPKNYAILDTSKEAFIMNFGDSLGLKDPGKIFPEHVFGDLSSFGAATAYSAKRILLFAVIASEERYYTPWRKIMKGIFRLPRPGLHWAGLVSFFMETPWESMRSDQREALCVEFLEACGALCSPRHFSNVVSKWIDLVKTSDDLFLPTKAERMKVPVGTELMEGLSLHPSDIAHHWSFVNTTVKSARPNNLFPLEWNNKKVILAACRFSEKAFDVKAKLIEAKALTKESN